MKSPFKIRPQLSTTSIDNLFLLHFLEAGFNTYFEKNKDIIEDYLYMKSKIEELQYRLDFQYRLTISNSKDSGMVINAKLKLPFVQKENSKSKYPFFNIHIGKLSNYKNGIKDPQVKIDAEKRIKIFIDKKYPFSILNIDYQLLEFHY
jgi:hypothetical protein